MSVATIIFKNSNAPLHYPISQERGKALPIESLEKLNKPEKFKTQS